MTHRAPARVGHAWRMDGERSWAERVYFFYEAASGFSLFVAVSAFSLFFIQRVGVSPLEFIFAGTVLEIAILLMEVPTGIVADTVSRRLSIIIGLATMGAGFGLTAVPSYPVILVGAVVWGIGFTFTSGADIAWITDEVGEERARPLYLRAAQLRFAATLAGLGVGAALGTIALWVPIATGAVLHGALAVVIALVMPETGFVGPGRAAAGDRNPFHAIRETVAATRSTVRASPVLLLILAVTVTIGFGSEGIDRLWQMHLLGVGLPEGSAILWMSGTWALGLIAGAGVAEILRRRADLHSRSGSQRAYLGVVCVILIGTLVLAVSPWFAVGAFAFVALTAARHAGKPVMDAWINQGLDPRTRATVNSVAHQAHAVGELGGGPLFGAVAQWVSLSWALAVTAISHAPAVVLLARRPGTEPAAADGSDPALAIP